MIKYKKHLWPVVFIVSFFLISYLIISSPYKHLRGDAGAFARHAKILYEKNSFDVTGSATATIGQLFFSNILCKLFGFDLKILHISVYLVCNFQHGLITPGLIPFTLPDKHHTGHLYVLKFFF